MKIMLETPQLILREMNEGDADALWELESDPEVHRYLGNHPVQHKDEIKTIIESVLRQYKENGIGRWAAVEKETGNLLFKVLNSIGVIYRKKSGSRVRKS